MLKAFGVDTNEQLAATPTTTTNAEFEGPDVDG